MSARLDDVGERQGLAVPAWLWGLGLAVAEWVGGVGLASLVWAMIGAGVEHWQGAAICAVLLLLWSVVGGAVLSWVAVFSCFRMALLAFLCWVGIGGLLVGVWPLEVCFLGGSVLLAGMVARQHTKQVERWRREAREP